MFSLSHCFYSPQITHYLKFLIVIIGLLATASVALAIEVVGLPLCYSIKSRLMMKFSIRSMNLNWSARMMSMVLCSHFGTIPDQLVSGGSSLAPFAFRGWLFGSAFMVSIL